MFFPSETLFEQSLLIQQLVSEILLLLLTLDYNGQNCIDDVISVFPIKLDRKGRSE